MDLTLLQGTLTGLKTAFDIAKGISDLKTMSEVQTKVIELQQTILQAQSTAMAANADQYAAIEELRLLKDEIKKIKGWESERLRYRLVTPNHTKAGVVYALKLGERQEDEPAHYICTTCYEGGKKSMLGLTQIERGGYFYWICPVCNTTVSSGTRGPSEAAFG